MVKKYRKGSKTAIRADVIVLGCSLPGIVTANKLKSRFGDSMDIVVLDLVGTSKVTSKCNVAFQEDVLVQSGPMSSDEDSSSEESKSFENTAKTYIHTVARHYLIKYANELKVPLPDAILNPTAHTSCLQKLFQFMDGNIVTCNKQFQEYKYLNFVEKFELNQYQKFLDTSMKRLFQTNTFDDPRERNRLLYYDRTTMEKNICEALLFSTSREIMRTTVKLACGAPAHTVSLLFYLHQCYRTGGTKHHLDGQNTRLREKLLGYCRKRISSQLQASVADITLTAKQIKNIRTYCEADVEQVMLETIKGETTYICNLLAMALKPDQLRSIEVDNHLLPEKEAMLAKSMTPGKAKKFSIQYEENFWVKGGYSGDILSMRGPIIWAMERPKLSFTGSVDKYFALIGYLMIRDDENAEDSKEAVVEQLTNLFGWEAANPVTYTESSIVDIFVPRCGDYVGLRVLTSEVSPRGLEWGAFDVFAEGDVAAALEAGHTAYLHLLSCLRPQAQTYEDISSSDWPTTLRESPLTWWLAHINVRRTIKLSVYTAVLAIGIKLLRTYLKQ